MLGGFGIGRCRWGRNPNATPRGARIVRELKKERDDGGGGEFEPDGTRRASKWGIDFFGGGERKAENEASEYVAP